MKQRRKTKYLLAGLVLVLALLASLSGVLASGKILQVEDRTPHTAVCIRTDRLAAAQTADKTAPTPTPAAAPQAAAPTPRPGSAVYDEVQTWSEQTSVAIFKAAYDNASGGVTVLSAAGDRLVAPGTENSYYFYVKNTGNTGMDYTVTAAARITNTVAEETYTVPLLARFYATGGEYLLGGRNVWASLAELNGISHSGDLAAGHVTRYTLDWQWPFEGDDVLDTLLGDLSANGEELTVEVELQVVASQNDEASGGSPETGDTGDLPLWAGLSVCSFLGLVLLLFRRKDKNETA